MKNLVISSCGHRGIGAAILVLTFWPSAARATVLVAADLSELARDAQAIARGRVIELEPRWTDDHRGIETLVTLAVDSYLKGSLGPTVQFRVPGGTLGHYRHVFVGAPEFALGQPVIVFLGSRGPSVPFVLGLSQGVFRLVRTAPDGWLVTPPAFLPGVAPATPIVRGDPGRQPLRLADFEQRVRALAGGVR